MLFRSVGLLAVFLFALAAPARATDTAPTPPSVADGAVVWSPAHAVSDATLFIAGPDGLTLSRAFTAGQRIALDPAGLDLPLPDGLYLYELRMGTVNADGEPSRTGQTGAFEVAAGAPIESAVMAQVFTQDVVVQGSQCIGVDCSSSPSFGFDTLRLKENNLRIKFDDTSSSASFPSNDWEITINDSTNGGASFFGITDVTAGRRVFAIEAGAPNNSVYVDDNGHLGLGTDFPIVEVHSADGDTPTLRLEQNGTNGWTPQTWDVAGNEANFFIRDVTNGSDLPFKIRPDAGTDRLVLTSTGVSIGQANPGAGFALDVNGAANIAGAASIAGVYNQSGAFARGTPVMTVTNTINNATLMELLTNGNLVISGSLVQGSDVNTKENVVPVDPEAVLRGVASLPISTWQYISDEGEITHLGPMAQDFHAAFGLGLNETTISAVDADGVALASVQALLARSDADRARIAELSAANADLEARLARLEALLTQTGADDE